MKKYILILVLLFSQTTFAQKFHKEYYENGKLKSVGKIPKDKRMKNEYLTGEWKYGKWKFYYENGKLEKKGFFDIKEQGEWKYYHKNGKLKAIGNYEIGLQTGEWKYYDENGNLKEMGNYEEGKRQGLWFLGTHKYGHYIRGVLYGIEEGDYNENGLKTGEWKYYDENGKLMESGYYEEGIKQGDWIYYDEYGYSFPVKIENYRNGEVISWKELDIGGNVKAEHTKDGIKYFDGPLGNLVSYHKVVNIQGILLWEHINYYPNGKIKSVEYYTEDGVKTGTWKYYDENGKLTQTKNY